MALVTLGCIETVKSLLPPWARSMAKHGQVAPSLWFQGDPTVSGMRLQQKVFWMDAVLLQTDRTVRAPTPGSCHESTQRPGPDPNGDARGRRGTTS